MKKMKAKKIKDYCSEIYQWDFEGLGSFKAVITDGKLENIDFLALNSGNLIFLKAIYQALGELFEILEKNKK